MKTLIIVVHGLTRSKHPITRQYTARTALEALVKANSEGIRNVQSIRVKG